MRAGLVTEREQMKFRNTHDIRVTNKQQKENQEHNIPDLVQKYFTSKFKNELGTSIMNSWPKPLSYSPKNNYLELDLNFQIDNKIWPQNRVSTAQLGLDLKIGILTSQLRFDLKLGNYHESQRLPYIFANFKQLWALNE